MKTREEIQKAHDVLEAYCNGELPFKPDADVRLKCIIVKMGLCWVLEDGHEDALQVILHAINNAARDVGFTLVNVTN